MFWARLAFQKGLALYPVPLKKITEKKFIANVKELLENRSPYTNAKEFSEQIKLEDGIKNAIELIEAKKQ